MALGARALFVRLGVGFRLTDIAPLTNVIKQLSGATTPMALLALGAQFEFSAISGMKREIIWGTVIRTLIVPALALGVAMLFPSFDGAHFAAFVGLYCTPLAISTVPMTQEMGSDGELAGPLVIFTTLASALGIFLFKYILRLFGIF